MDFTRPLNADYLLSQGVDFCLGGETSTQLVELVESFVAVEQAEARGPCPTVIDERIEAQGDVSVEKLPTLDVYAQFEDDGEVRTVGYTGNNTRMQTSLHTLSYTACL